MMKLSFTSYSSGNCGCWGLDLQLAFKARVCSSPTNKYQKNIRVDGGFLNWGYPNSWMVLMGIPTIPT